MSWLPLRVVPRRAWPNAPPQCWNPEGRHMEEFVRHFEHFEYSKTSWKMVIVKSKRKPIQRFRTYHDISTWSRIFLPKKENLTLLYNHLVVWGAMTGTPSPTLQPSVPRSVFTPTAFSAKQLAQKKHFPTSRFYLFHSCAHCALSHLYTKSIQTARFYTKPENPTIWSLENLWVTLMLTSRHHDTSRITSINKVSRRKPKSEAAGACLFHWPATRPVQTDMRRRSTCPAGFLDCEIHTLGSWLRILEITITYRLYQIIYLTTLQCNATCYINLSWCVMRPINEAQVGAAVSHLAHKFPWPGMTLELRSGCCSGRW